MTTGATEAKITEEKVERLRQRIGVDVPGGDVVPFNTVATLDTMRHFAHGYGDDNPLFTDETHGASSRWSSCIAPPMYAETMGYNDVPSVDEATRQLLRGDPLAGIGALWSGVEWEWWRPVTPGDILYKRSHISDVIYKRSEFGGGHAVHVKHRTLYRNQLGEPVCASYRIMIHAERETSAKAGKYVGKQRHHYTPEEIAEIDAAYEAEQLRGATPRYWEDVTEGEAMPKMVKGPLTVTDMISMHMGWGWGGYRVAPLRLGYLNRKRIPKFYIPNDHGVPDVAQRLHWTDDWARQTGAPYAYDYGFMRDNWLTQYAVNWMGDDAWLWKFRDEIRRFNFVGDTQWIEGKVVRKHQEHGRYAVDLEMWATNQDGEVTTTATATVLLPARANGLPVLPEAPDDIKRLALAKVGINRVQAPAG